MNSMQLTPSTRALVDRVINVFQTGAVRGDYGALYTLRNGPHGLRQIIYGRARTKEFDKLRILVLRYAQAKGTFSNDLGQYLWRVGALPLYDDLMFRALLRRAGRLDPAMRSIQDEFFEADYYTPAMRWAALHGLTLPLSALVVYDSFVQSGAILPLIRRTFPERTPSEGGDERTWTRAYVAARHRWLLSHPRPHVRRSSSRTRCLGAQIERGNWHLEQLPIHARGVAVT